MPVQPVSDISRLLAEPLVDPKTGKLTPSWNYYFRYNIHTKVFGSMDLQGIVKAGAADFARPYTNKQLDNIPDGKVYARPRGGKNLIPNPGFEFNVTGVTPNLNLPIGPICDSWNIISQSAFHQNQLNPGVGRNNSQCILSRLATGVTVPNDGLFYENRVFTAGQLPIATGDFLRVSGWLRWDRQVIQPAGVTLIQRIGFYTFAQNGTKLTEHFIDNVNGSLGIGAWVFQNVTLQVPNSDLGQTPASVVVQASAFVQNSSIAPFNTGGVLYADLRYDDFKVVIQNTAFDLTPINTAGTPITNAQGICTQVGTTTTINVAASTWQFGDGQVSYNSGSVNPGSLGTWYIYADDPTFSGGAVTYQATASASVCNAVNGRLVFGTITTTGGGNVVSQGGGSGGGGPRGKNFLI